MTPPKTPMEEKNIVEIGIDKKGNGVFYIVYNDGQMLKTNGDLTDETEKVIRHLQSSVMMNWDRVKIAKKEAEEKQKEFIEKITNKKKDTIHNIEVCQKGIKLKDSNLEYHRWNLSAQEVLLTLLLNLEAEFGGKE